MILKSDIKDIRDIVVDAFNDIDIIECDSEGLFNYIKDCNEDFLDEEREAERLCYWFFFINEANLRNIALTSEQIKDGDEALKRMKKHYPQYYEIVKSISDYV